MYSNVDNPNEWIDVFGSENGVLVNKNPQTEELRQARTYDSNGNPVRDIDFGNEYGFGDPHAHDWNYPSG